jgi:hypothetical protein
MWYLRVSAPVRQWTVGRLKSVIVSGTSRRSLFVGAKAAVAIAGVMNVGTYSRFRYAKEHSSYGGRVDAFWTDRHANSSADFGTFIVAINHTTSAPRAVDPQIVSGVLVGLPFSGAGLRLSK